MQPIRQRILWILLALSLGACAVPPEEQAPPPPPTEVTPEQPGAEAGAEAGQAGGVDDSGATASGLETGLGPDGLPIGADAPADAAAECPPPCEFRRDAINDPASDLSAKVIYFDYDQSEIRQEFVDLITAHGRYLASYPDVKVRLEGHTDERGAREYNIALGERRAQSVERLLLLQGVTRAQLSLLSYGEELPAALGHTEDAWQQNRRVELVYENP